MGKRLRIAYVTVQPVLMFDDGEELTPGPVIKPLELPLSELEKLSERLPAEVKRLECEMAD